ADRAADIKRAKPRLPALIEQGGVERKSRKSGVAAENPGEREQARVLRPGLIGAKSEIAGDQAHDQRTGHIDEERAPRKIRPQQPGREEVYGVTQAAAEPGAEKNEKIGLHRRSIAQRGARVTKPFTLAPSAFLAQLFPIVQPFGNLSLKAALDRPVQFLPPQRFGPVILTGKSVGLVVVIS